MVKSTNFRSLDPTLRASDASICTSVIWILAAAHATVAVATSITRICQGTHLPSTTVLAVWTANC
jgi:hypothetical protein